jgi:hypothetical protein
MQLGRAVVHGLRHPARGVLTMPRDIVRIWRRRGKGGKPTSGGPVV